MYTLQKIEKTLETNKDNYFHKYLPYNCMPLILYDLNKKIPYGREGGTNYKNTHYNTLSLAGYNNMHRWYSTQEIVCDFKFYFYSNDHYSITEDYKWEDSYDLDRLINLTEESIKMQIENILLYFNTNNEIYYNSKYNIFWTDKGYIAKIFDIKEDLSNITSQKSELLISVSSIFENSKNEKTYYRNGYGPKQRGQVPKTFEIINKDKLVKILRSNFIIVANRFLSQDFIESPNTPAMSDIIYTQDKAILERYLQQYENNIYFKDILKL